MEEPTEVSINHDVGSDLGAVGSKDVTPEMTTILYINS